MQYLGIDWGTRRAAWCALTRAGELREGVISADENGLARLVVKAVAPLERELRPVARSDERASLLMTIPGVAELLALTLAAEIGDISRFPSPRKLVGYAGLAPRVKQSGQSSHTGRLSKAGPATLR